MLYSIIRSFLTILLLFGVYSETGIWTTIALALICLHIEGAYLKEKAIQGSEEKQIDELERILKKKA